MRAGGAGFIGSHVVQRLLIKNLTSVVVYDNFSSGTEAHLAGVVDDTCVVSSL